MNIKTKIKIALSAILISFVGGCNLSPKPLTKEEIISHLYKDRMDAYENVEPIVKPITLHDAVARAIKYNLQYKVKVSEAAIGLIERQAVTYEMLPDLIANTNFVTRSNDGALSSPLTGLPSTARNRDTWLYDLNLSWNILDFGISYYNSKQKGNEYLMLEEKKRTMLQEIVRDTRTAYWASQVSNVIMPQVLKLSDDLKVTIDKSVKQEKEKLIERDKAARYRVELWQTTSEINRMAHNLERAKQAFAALINVPTYKQFSLDDNFKYKVQKQHLPYDIRELELIGLHNRPEIREEILQNKIAMDEINKARLRLIPNFTLIFGGNYDSTTYLVDQYWREASMKVTWNIFKLFSRYYELEKAKSTQELGSIRRQALAVSIITQINVAYTRIKEAEWNHKIAKSIFDDNLIIYENEKNRKSNDLASDLDLMRAKISYIEAKFKLLTSHYDRITAYNELLDALGYNSINQVTSVDLPLDKLSNEIQSSFNSNDGFYITYDEIKSLYNKSEVLNTHGQKKLSEEIPASDSVDPRLLKNSLNQPQDKIEKVTPQVAAKVTTKLNSKVVGKENSLNNIIGKTKVSIEHKKNINDKESSKKQLLAKDKALKTASK